MQTNTAVIRTENRSTDPIERAHWNDPYLERQGTRIRRTSLLLLMRF